MAEKKKTTGTTTRRKKKKSSSFMDTAKIFSRFEVLFIVVLFLGFFVWAFSKCSAGGAPPSTPNTTTPLTNEDTAEDISPAAANNPNSPTYNLDEVTAPNNTPTVSAPTGGEVEIVSRPGTNNPSSSSRRSYTPLYVTLQDLKVRKGPSRDSAIISVLQLNEEVMFMEKRTDFRERINIGTETTNEPWVYIQTKKGHKGWVYGAGIHYFKWDRLKDPIPSISNEVDEFGE